MVMLFLQQVFSKCAKRFKRPYEVILTGQALAKLHEAVAWSEVEFLPRIVAEINELLIAYFWRGKNTVVHPVGRQPLIIVFRFDVVMLFRPSPCFGARVNDEREVLDCIHP